MKKILTTWKLLLAMLLAVTAPLEASANEVYGNTSSEYAIKVGDFGYFFYKSYDVPGQTLTNVCTMVLYDGYTETAVLPDTAEFQGVKFPVVGIDWRFREDNHVKCCKQLTIPASVIVIEQGAFNDIDQITHLTFKDGPNPIYCYDCGSRHSRYGAFTYMDGLQEVYLGRELAWDYSEYDQAPFYRNNDGSYFNVTVGPQVNTIHYHTFDHARVKDVTLLESEATISIEEDAFNDTDIEVWSSIATPQAASPARQTATSTSSG